MGICIDSSTKFLKKLGYNVVRLPRQGIEPLQLLGVQSGETQQLGSLKHLIVSGGQLPPIVPNHKAADVNGQRSSELSAALGLNILGAIIGSMGGTLGIKAKYKFAKTITFEYANVTGDAVAPLDVGVYLREAEIDVSNPIIEQYVLGNGRLYLVTRTLKSTQFAVEAKTDRSGSLELSVPTLKEVIGGDIDVEVQQGEANRVTYRGKKALVFGFQCLDVGVRDGVLSLENAAAGSVAMSHTPEPAPVILDEGGLLSVR